MEKAPETRGDGDERVLVLAPLGRNGELINLTLARAGVHSVVCNDVDQLCTQLHHHPPGAAIVCEEVFNRATLNCLVHALEQQPPWSEVPVLVLTGGGKTTRGSVHVAEALGPRGNVTLLERPVRILTLLSAVRAALRARKRQYQLRDLLAREQAARAQAESASRAKDHFLATLSHELRTPLNPVLMVASAMLEDSRLPEDMRDDLDLIKRNIELESKLIDDLLDLTRIARGKLELHHETVDLHTLIHHVLATCGEGDLQRRNLTLRTELYADRHHICGDSARLSQVFWNLLKNAIKFTPDGGVITIRTVNQDGGIVASVSDNGIGIDPIAIGRIFDAFEQADRVITRQFGGLGLGLAICKALVDLHGGELTAHSDGKGKGATFVVKLDAVNAPMPVHQPCEPANGNGKARGGLNVLLVEDHGWTARVMSRLLKRLEHQVSVAGDVATAKDLVARERFDLIISDLGLPDGTGFDFLKYVRRQSTVPAIAVTGYGMEDDVRRSREVGFNIHLVKPIDLGKLRTAIQTAVIGGAEAQ